MSCTGNLPPLDLSQITSTTILAGEHRVILQVLSSLVGIADAAERDGRIQTTHASWALEVLRNFADRCHHGKEEEILFPALEARVPGFGPTQVMRSEHIDGRAHVRAMGEALASGELARFVANARGYVELLRNHIAKEDTILFPIAASMIGPDHDAAIVDAYRRIEHDDMGDGTHERMLATADVLADAYGVARASTDPQILALLTAVCGCHQRA